MTFKASRTATNMQEFSEASQQELKIAGKRTRYALNLFGDLQFNASSRSEGDARKPLPAFGLGAFDMLFTANLENNLTMTTEFAATYDPNNPLAELERLHIRWRPSRHFWFEAGRFHTDVGYWNVAYHHGRYLQLTVERPRTILLHGGLIPNHIIGANMGVAANVGSGVITMTVSGGTFWEQIGSGHAAHGGAHGQNLTSVNGVHGKLDFGGYLHRDLHFGVSGIWDRIPDEPAFNRPALPDQSINEAIGNAYIALPTVPTVFITEAYVIQHSLTANAKPENVGSKWRTYGAFALLGYTIGKFTPYIRGEYISSQVGAYFLDPFYIPDAKSGFGLPVTLDVKEGIAGTRIDISDWCAIKLEYQIMAGVGTRRPELPKPLIHSGVASWSFGI